MKVACPKCGANVEYISDIEKCYCEYCGSLITMNELQNEDKNQIENNNQTNQKHLNNNEINIREKNIEYEDYTCTSCGAKLITAESMLITDCIYCGSKQFVKGKFKDGFMPDKIIPFKIKREECINIYNEYIKNGNEIPSNKVNKLKITEIKGVYVPFYVYKFENLVEAQGKFKVRDMMHFVSYQEKILFMKIRQGIQMEVPQCASSKMRAKVLNKLEKYDLSGAEKFHPAYLMNFFAEVPDKNKDKETEVAELRCMQEANNFIRRSGYKLIEGSFEGDISELGYELVMLPIWFLTCECEGKLYQLIMNGQTGKFISLIDLRKLPKHKDTVITSITGILFVMWVLYLFISFGAFLFFGDGIRNFIRVFWIILTIIAVKSTIKSYNKEKKEKERIEKNLKTNPDEVIPYSWNCNLLDRKVYLESRYTNEEEYRKKRKYIVEKDIKYIVSRNGKNARQIYLYKDNA